MKRRAIQRLLLRRARMKRRPPPGSAPGTLMPDPAAPRPAMRAIAYGSGATVERLIESPEEAAALRAQHRVVWLNVDAVGDVEVIRHIGKVFNLHPLALEDVVHTHQRPKLEPYPEHLFIVAREMSCIDHLEHEQMSIFLGKGYVLSFQERAGDCFNAVRERLRDPASRFHTNGADYLAYALLDATVDSYFPVVERLGERLEELEPSLLSCPKQDDVARLHEIKRDLFTLRRAAWPLRETLNVLVRDESPFVSPDTRMFLRDCVDHTIQILDLVETDRELCSDLMDVYLWSVSHKLNSVMKVLTIISTIFIPLTFLAGVYGMNFHTDKPLNMPELSWAWGYPLFWSACGLVALGLLGLFWRLGWLSESGDRRR